MRGRSGMTGDGDLRSSRSDVTRAWVLGAPPEQVLYAEHPGDWTAAAFDPETTNDPRRWQA